MSDSGDKPKRAATEVLLEIESLLVAIKQEQSAQRFNSAAILGQVNALSKKVDGLTNILNELLRDPDQHPIDTNSDQELFSRPINAVELEDEQLASQQTVFVDNDSPGIRRNLRPETFVHDTTPTPKKVVAEVLPPSVAADGSVMVPVLQKILDSNSKPIFQASVEITELINGVKGTTKKCKTNAVGKWQIQLKPGKYQVLVLKTEQLTKKKLQLIQEIDVGGTKIPFELPAAMMR